MIQEYRIFEALNLIKEYRLPKSANEPALQGFSSVPNNPLGFSLSSLLGSPTSCIFS